MNEITIKLKIDQHCILIVALELALDDEEEELLTAVGTHVFEVQESIEVLQDSIDLLYLVLLADYEELEQIQLPSLTYIPPIPKQNVTFDNFTRWADTGFNREEVIRIAVAFGMPETYTIGSGRHSFKINVRYYIYYIIYI